LSFFILYAVLNAVFKEGDLNWREMILLEKWAGVLAVVDG